MNITIEIHAKLDDKYPEIPLIKFDAVETFEDNQLTSVIEPINFIRENFQQLIENDAFINIILIPDKNKSSEEFKTSIKLKECRKDYCMSTFRSFKSFLNLYFQGAFKELLLSALSSDKYILVSKR